VVSKGHFPTAWGGDTGAIGLGGVREFDLNTGVGDALLNAFRRKGYPTFDLPRVRITHRIKAFRAYFNAFTQAAGRRSELPPQRRRRHRDRGLRQQRGK